MHEILYNLPSSSIVLDLGCSGGSFDPASFPFITVRVDVKSQPQPLGNFIQADAAKLPFRARTFDVIICNHGLEHFHDLKPTLQEIGRVLRREGALFVSVPDATTFQDRIYRWLTNGGGHVNLFDNPEALVKTLAWYSGLPHVATKMLYASFAFLNRRNFRGFVQKRLAFFSCGGEFALLLLSGVLRYIDRRFSSRTSVYGWAIYFGNIPEPVVLRPWTNVCIRCGQGHPSDWLAHIGAVQQRWLHIKRYLCPACGAMNIYSQDEHFVSGVGD